MSFGRYQFNHLPLGIIPEADVNNTRKPRSGDMYNIYWDTEKETKNCTEENPSSRNNPKFYKI